MCGNKPKAALQYIIARIAGIAKSPESIKVTKPIVTTNLKGNTNIGSNICRLKNPKIKLHRDHQKERALTGRVLIKS